MSTKEIKQPNRKTLEAFKEADDIISEKLKAKKYKSVKNLRKDFDL